MPTSNVNLTPELVSFVQEQVETGHFNNNSEVHRAALAAMKKVEEERQARLDRLRAEIQVGLDDIEAGRSVEIKGEEELHEMMSEIGNQARQELKDEGVEIAP